MPVIFLFKNRMNFQEGRAPMYFHLKAGQEVPQPVTTTIILLLLNSQLGILWITMHKQETIKMDREEEEVVVKEGWATATTPHHLRLEEGGNSQTHT